ncbi:MAG: ATP-binding cassette domain-containing protein [Firmicutes bacterium]|nr:ATP-binding cassette domain-containing protein [Bacillota bacterium]
MLRIKSLTISYDKKDKKKGVLSEVDVEFKRGKVTVIKGKSGSGKSSLLNVIGLMQTAPGISYKLDEINVSDLNDRERSDFRMNQIGFVFQSSNMLKEFTVKENLMVPMSIVKTIKEAEKKAKELIKYVGLETLENDYPESLSGGEEQRLGVARAIANDGDVILADEPTASLDIENSKKIIDLLSKLAHELGKIVIIASHSDWISNQADEVYKIEKEKLVIIKSSSNEDIYVKKSNKYYQKKDPWNFFKFYAKKRMGNKILNRIFIFVTGLMVAITMLFVDFGKKFIENQNKLMNAISERSIFLKNDVLGLQSKSNTVGSRSFSRSEMKEIESIGNISKLYPYYNFFSSGRSDTGSKSDSAKIVVKDKEEPIIEIDYLNTGGQDSRPGQFSVNPLYDEENFSYLLEYKSNYDLTSGIILTMSLARDLSENPSILIDKKIEITCFVPTKLYESMSTLPSRNGISNKKILVDEFYYKLIKIDSIITGILSKSYESERSVVRESAFLKYDKFIDIINENKDMNLHKDRRFPEKELAPSSLVIFADSVENVPKITSKLQDISSSFNVMPVINDTETIRKNNLFTRRTMTYMSLMFVFITIIMFALLYYFKNRTRRKEIGILKALGFTRLNIIGLSLFEMLKLSFTSFTLSIIFAFALSFLFNLLLFVPIFYITAFSVFLGFLINVIVTVFSGVLPMYFITKIDPVDAIRKIYK